MRRLLHARRIGSHPTNDYALNRDDLIRDHPRVALDDTEAAFFGIESPVGIALKATLDKSRKRHGALPAVNEETILKFQATDGLR